MATPTAVAGRIARPRATGLWRDAWGRLRKNRLAVVGLFLVIGLVFLGVFGPLLAPYPYSSTRSCQIRCTLKPASRFSVIAVR